MAIVRRQFNAAFVAGAARSLVADPRAFLARRVRQLQFLTGWVTRSGAARYGYMQRRAYEQAAGASDYQSPRRVDLVVGSYDAHNDWPDYDTFTMRYIDASFADKLALDFGCGPARNIIKYGARFRRMDGADISARNLDNARANLLGHGLVVPNLYVTNGADVGDAPSATYDFVMSVISLQHICVHAVRQAIIKDIARVLKPGGRFSAQMGYGAVSPASVGYYDNHFNALSTNRGCDTRVESAEQLRADLEREGFVQFESWIRPVGPGDIHPNWIFFTAVRA